MFRQRCGLTFVGTENSSPTQRPAPSAELGVGPRTGSTHENWVEGESHVYCFLVDIADGVVDVSSATTCVNTSRYGPP